MRSFAFVPEELIQDDYVPQFVEGNPVYQESVTSSGVIPTIRE